MPKPTPGTQPRLARPPREQARAASSENRHSCRICALPRPRRPNPQGRRGPCRLLGSPWLPLRAVEAGPSRHSCRAAAEMRSEGACLVPVGVAGCVSRAGHCLGPRRSTSKELAAWPGLSRQEASASRRGEAPGPREGEEEAAMWKSARNVFGRPFFRDSRICRGPIACRSLPWSLSPAHAARSARRPLPPWSSWIRGTCAACIARFDLSMLAPLGLARHSRDLGRHLWRHGTARLDLLRVP
jgi:hypothetical protein